MKIRIDVVGLSHWDVRDRWKEYAAEAVGKQLTFVPEPENVKDPYAVRAREGSLHIGYVAVSDLDMFYQALKGSGKKRLRGTVVESFPEPALLNVECEVDSVDWDYEPFSDKPYENWHYEGIPLMPQKLLKLQDLADDLTDELEAPVCDASRERVLGLTKQLVETNPFDLSREMTRTRYRIERLLSQREDPELRELTTKLRQQKGLLMSHETRDEVARYLFIELPTKLRQKGFERSHYTYDNRLDQLEALLRSFPFQLYDKFQNDPVDFLREVYYNHVPRHLLFQLLSGIILMILKGRTNVLKWGRDGDTEPLEQIKALGKPQPQKSQTGPLFTAEAEPYWQALEEAGFVGKDRRLLPSTTRQQAMYIAEAFAQKLRLKTKWKLFQDFWGINNLAQERKKMEDTGKLPASAKEIDLIFEE
jgi:hypothetical protein